MKCFFFPQKQPSELCRNLRIFSVQKPTNVHFLTLEFFFSPVKGGEQNIAKTILIILTKILLEWYIFPSRIMILLLVTTCLFR